MKFCQIWDLNCGSLVSEATALPTDPQPLPFSPQLNEVLLAPSKKPRMLKKAVNYFLTSLISQQESLCPNNAPNSTFLKVC